MITTTTTRLEVTSGPVTVTTEVLPGNPSVSVWVENPHRRVPFGSCYLETSKNDLPHLIGALTRVLNRLEGRV